MTARTYQRVIESPSKPRTHAHEPKARSFSDMPIVQVTVQAFSMADLRTFYVSSSPLFSRPWKKYLTCIISLRTLASVTHA
jgi:hypothetical protein